jgi:uncharacterized protein
MNPNDLLQKYFTAGALEIIVPHSRLVAEKALRIARNCPSASELDLAFIEEAAMVHDIGISQTDTPMLGCHGSAPYIMHGVLGRDLLEKEGYPLHALACERHIGVGLTVEDIVAQGLPLPKRDMIPLSLEEKIIACADLFYSKRPGMLTTEKTTEQVRTELAKFGGGKAAVFDQWLKEFSVEKSI